MLSRIKRHIMAIVTALLLTAATAQPMYSASRGWEVIKAERVDAKTVVRDTEIEIKAATGVVIITTSHPVQVKVFTILGRLVSNETAPAGKSQLTLPAHGVYIVKVGDLTCKVAV